MSRAYKNEFDESIVSVQGMTIEFSSQPIRRALDNVSISIDKGETLGLVGESGAGKTTLALALLGLLPDEARIVSGNVFWRGQQLTNLGGREFAKLRGKEIGAIFQDARASLNPVYPVGVQLEWILRDHLKLTRRQARDRAIELLVNVHLSDAEVCSNRFPNQLSGGMCQRVMIAMAIALGPSLLIADEPTSGLDVLTQAEILKLLSDISRTTGMSILMITHDLSVAAAVCDTIAVMREGRLVECLPIRDFLRNPSSPYSRQLIGAVLDLRERFTEA